ncbi:Mur ligase [Gloeophyllum trabeum ATCC 11539]|uniref:Mur ligase n=1 Tax=Gloeophyllum trabeum (strain ATCC 11539 / FP-39264 / Madison 617) TaxID=670483 RepID=S7PTI9_GLOTA|nr:Mur ligase [Gloeophyllum trabeum ATCC 11539]EPQ51076.1 Mur ligase [Gloeophyllum trabeum ATCC 11539]
MSIDLSLDRIRKLLSHLPRYTRPTVHIAGTNGKGSVSSLVSSILHATVPPLKVGRFNSPHLVSVHDSIAVNNEPISPATYTSAKELVEETDRKHDIGSSSFELLTSTALLIFEQERVDVVVLEVGMGGRLDATNVVPDECVIASALTAVDLDHQAFLGSTVAEIAKEKAAIARPGKPFVLGPQKYPEVQDVVKEVVATAGGQLIHASPASSRTWDNEFDGPGPAIISLSQETFAGPSPTPIQMSLPCFSEPLRAVLPLHGEHQLSNLGVALNIISALITCPCDETSVRPLQLKQRLTPSAISRGVRSVSWPGRLSFHRVRVPLTEDNRSARPLTILADGAHNPASSATLAAYVSSLIPAAPRTRPAASVREISLTYILALSHSPPKTPLQTLAPLLPPTVPQPEDSRPVKLKVQIAVLRFSPPDGMPWINSVPPSVLRETVSTLVPDAEVWCAPEDAQDPTQLLAALQWAAKQTEEADESLVVLAGSLYLVADFYRLIRAGRLGGATI